MKRLLLILTVLTATGWGQLTVFTTTTAIVRDPASVIYANGTYNISFVSATTGQNFVGLYAVVPASQSGSLDSFGAMNVQLIDNLQISPTGSQWRFSICSASGVTCFSTNITVTGASQDISAALQAAAAFLPTSGGGTTLPGVKVVDGSTYTTIQGAITAAGSTGSVLIPSTYAGTDTYTNPSGIQILDLRRVASGPARYRGFINVLTDCGLKGDGVTDDSAAIQACFTAFQGQKFLFPMTQTGGACSYNLAATVFPKGEGTYISGESAGFKNSNTTQVGTVLCSPAGVTPLEFDLTGSNCSGCGIQDISLMGSEGTDHLISPTKLNIPSGANLPLYKRTITSIQRAANVLTVNTSLVAGIEGLTQQVGSTILISGVVSDATMNGRCIVATLVAGNGTATNPTQFTCSQNGSNLGPFVEGTVGLPTTGASTADGIRVCTNFLTIKNVVIANFGRHGINADSSAAQAMCPSNFSDDLVVRDSFLVGNQANGYLCNGLDCNAHLLSGNAVYYNVLWGLEDQSPLGNTHIGNQLSNGGHQWAATTTPATKAISTISRTLSSGQSIVTVVLSVADANLKLGSCVVIAGVTDASFNTTAGQCFFITTYTDSTHFQYEQPGAPTNASSSGGTSRMAKFSEAYLSSGVDDGAQKIQTQSAVAQTVITNQYVEGGQACKFGSSTLLIGGANTPGCAATADWTGSFITTQGVVVGGAAGFGTNLAGFANGKDATNQLFFRAGLPSGTVRHFFFRWLNNNDATDAWGLDVDPTGAAGISGTWIFGRGTAGSVTRRLSFFGASNASGITRLGSESTGAVQFNMDANNGTGGIAVGSGGAVPAIVTTIDSTGKATFNHGLVIAGSQEATSLQGTSGTKLFACTGSFTSGNYVKSDANGNCVDGGSGTGSASAAFFSACTGVATSSATRAMPNLGTVTSTSCTNGYLSGLEIPVPHSGNLQNLRVVCGAGGVNGSSGVFTVMKNGSTTTLTVTIGTSTSIISDVTHQVAVTAGTDTIGLQFTTQAAETLSTCRASFELQ